MVLNLPIVRASDLAQTATTTAATTPTAPPPTPTPLPTPTPTPTSVAEAGKAGSSSGLPIVPVFLGIILLGFVFAVVVPFVRSRLRR